MKKISLNDLPKYSNSVKKILSKEKEFIKQKTKDEVHREFEIETWGTILSSTPEDKFNIDFVENKYLPLNEESLFIKESQIYLATNKEILEKHVDLYENILSKYINKSSCLVEFGAGFGSKLFKLAERNTFKDKEIYAFELTHSGRFLIEKISRYNDLNIKVGFIDLREKKFLNDFEIPSGALIFTSYAAHYDPYMNTEFARFMHEFQPSAVVNFEPCYELYDDENIHGLLCRKYIEDNDYTQNVWSSINNYCINNNLNIYLKKNVIGYNPLMPISIIEWAFD